MPRRRPVKVKARMNADVPTRPQTAIAKALAAVAPAPATPTSLERYAVTLNPPNARAPRYGREVYEDATGHDPDNMRSLQAMRQMWTFAGGYYPGAKTMPAPDFFPQSGPDADAWVALEPEGEPRGSHVAWPKGIARALARQGHGAQARGENDAAESTLLHEWAHMHQSPSVLADEKLRESGAEALAWALAPTVTRRAGKPYSQRGSVPAYPLKAALERGPRFVFRGQFR